MAQDYYTLEEAAAIVRMAPDDLKQMARKGELRSFQDRGTWRFRVQDIQELARARGVGSDPDLVLGEATAPRPADSPAPRAPGKREGEVFDFDLKTDEESIGVGHEFLLDTPGGSGRKPGSRSKVDGPKSGPKSPGPRSPAPKSGPKSPPPKPGSDSDVRLVAEGSDVDFQLNLDSDAKLVDDSGPPPQVKQRGRTGATGPASPRPGGPASPRPGKGGPASPRPGQPDAKRRTGAEAPPVDSGVRLVPMDSDSDVRIVGAGSDDTLAVGNQPPRSHSDSDIRLEQHQQPRPASDEGNLTEEINLDEELRKEEAQRKKSSQSKLRPKPQQPAPPPAASPFELSEPDVQLPAESEPLPQAKSGKDSSSDFELTPAAEDNSPLDLGSSDLELTPAAASSSPLDPSSDEEFKLELPEDDIGVGHRPVGGKKGPDSGIRLDKPVDSGISLEQGGEGSDEIEFELSLDAEHHTPRPHSPAAQKPADSDSEFELTLDAEDAKPGGGADSSDFELTLDTEEPKAAPGAAADSDSEFELTLDGDGGLSPLEEDASPQLKADSDEKDIFETDFEVPALEEDSGSEAVATEDADTGLDSSDFDLELDAEGTPSADESASEVVALEEEPAAAPRKGKKKAAAIHAPAADEEEVEAEPDFGGLEQEAEVESEEEPYEEEEPARTVVKEKLIPAAPWGVFPVIFMSLCVPIMIVVALLGFELVQGMNGHKTPGLVTRTITNLLPK